ncbi:MAG: tRNA-dihydrouridine synthase family protein [Bacteroidetes bacterium]|nr:tRNA-dihydrouridine synthase family protein [Bacteroidota bacterium]
MHLILAPLHGFTEVTFREVYFRHFGGIDKVMAPFISLTHGDKITALKVKDVLPERNAQVPVIPQVLGNDSDDFILLCRFLSDELGYKEVNWNLGCPINGIVRKKRGSGILPFPEMIDQLLEKIIPGISMDLSIKLRLGLKTTEEFTAVAEVLNNYPLKNITIHPRIGIQQYEGNVLLDDLERMIPYVKHPIIYNGDIHSFDDYVSIRNRFSFGDFMLGRGVFYNPFLPEMIKAETQVLPADAKARFINFYTELETATRHSRKFWMSKMKEYWKYYGTFMKLGDERQLQLFRVKSEDEWNSLVSEILASP